MGVLGVFFLLVSACFGDATSINKSSKTETDLLEPPDPPHRFV